MRFPIAAKPYPSTDDLIARFIERLETRFGHDSLGDRFRMYRANPRRFALKILGSRWTSAQEQVAQALVRHGRVAVRSGHGVGKTYLAADLVLWFLYTHPDAVVLTTAPTWRQVKHFLWREIRKRHTGARIKLPGRLLRTRLELNGDSYAMGIATESSGKGVNFQGCHADNLLIVLDEASGIPSDIWEAAEGAALGRNNKILAIGNPLTTTGRFYEIVKGSRGWTKVTINAMDHPNITGKGRSVPGCITTAWLEDRLTEWCEEVERSGEVEEYGSMGVTPENGAVTPHTPHTSQTPDVFAWNGRTYRPTDPFRIRVLGEFPRSDEQSLIPLAWIEAAQNRMLPPNGSRRFAVDVARFGDDHTIIGMRQGPVLQKLWPIKGMNTTGVARRVEELAYEHHPETIAIDSIGIGAGVVDELNRREIAGVTPLTGSGAPHDRERFANHRAELYWGLRERFFHGDIQLTDDPLLAEELAQIRYVYSSSGRIQIEAKESLKRRLGRSPDRADMLAMLFYAAWPDQSAIRNPQSEIGRAAQLCAEMEDW